MTGRDNVRFVARIYGAHVGQVERFVLRIPRSWAAPMTCRW